MAAFEYQALDERGRTKKGVLSADTARLARDKLRELGLTPLNLETVTDSQANKSKGSKFKSAQSGGRHKINSTEFAVMMRQLSTLLGSGLTVEDSLNALIKQVESLNAQAVLTGIRSSILEGRTLADSMALYPRSFDELYVATISAGEQTGKLPEIMDRLADYTETKQRLQRDITGKLAYPIIILFVAVAVVVFMVTFIVPKIVQVYVDNDQVLPLITRIVIAISDFFQQYGLVLLILLGALSFLGMLIFRRPAQKLWLHERFLKLPFLKKLIRGINTARMARTLSIMAGSGVPLLAAMKSSSRVLGNHFMRKNMERATQDVSEGVSLSRAVERTEVFPPMLVQMISSGEASGKLDSMLEKAAQSTENELEARLNTLVSLFEPIMVLIMGLLVFVIVVAILLPIFDLNQIIG